HTRFSRDWSSDVCSSDLNNGGDMVEAVLRRAAEAMAAEGHRRNPDLAYRKVTASRGKQARAEPVAALYEQGRVHHTGRFDALEEIGRASCRESVWASAVA